MTQDEIIEMAKQAGLDIDSWEPLTGFGVYECTHEELERFATLVASAEREACVKAIEEQIAWDLDDPESTAIKVIRARGQA